MTTPKTLLSVPNALDRVRQGEDPALAAKDVIGGMGMTPLRMSTSDNKNPNRAKLLHRKAKMKRVHEGRKPARIGTIRIRADGYKIIRTPRGWELYKEANRSHGNTLANLGMLAAAHHGLLHVGNEVEKENNAIRLAAKTAGKRPKLKRIPTMYPNRLRKAFRVLKKDVPLMAEFYKQAVKDAGLVHVSYIYRQIAEAKKAAPDKALHAFANIATRIAKAQHDKYNLIPQHVEAFKDYDARDPVKVAKALAMVHAGDIEGLMHGVSDFVLRILSRKYPEVKAKLLSLKGIDRAHADRIKQVVDPEKGTGKTSKDMTPETHPQSFTRKDSKGEQHRLIKPAHPNAELNPEWDPADPHGSHYATYKNPSTRKIEHYYTTKYKEVSGNRKFDIIHKAISMWPEAQKKMAADAFKDTDKGRAALVALLIDNTWARLGNSSSAQDNQFGMHNILAGHAKITHDQKGNKVLTIEYAGKQGHVQKHVINAGRSELNRKIVDRVERLKANRPADKKLFKVSSDDVNDYIKSLGVPKGFTAHKIRHVHATVDSHDRLNVNPPPLNTKGQAMAFFKKVVSDLKDKLHHENLNTTLKNYVDPLVPKRFLARHGIKAPKNIADVIAKRHDSGDLYGA